MIRFLIGGTGWVAGEYVKAVQKLPNASIAGVYSANPEYAAARMRELGVDAPLYTDFAEAASRSDVDAVILCSTPERNLEKVTLAAQNGKHLVIDKPVCMTREELWTMEEVLRRHPVKTVVSFVLRWNPLFETARSLIDDDALGRIFMAQLDYWHNVGPHIAQHRWSTRKEGGGSTLLSAGCHAVDGLRYFAGEVTEVKAYGCGTWADSTIEFDPNIIAIMRLANGGIGKVSATRECVTPYKYNIQLLGEKGTLLDNQLYTNKLPGQTDYATIPTVLPSSGDVSHHPFYAELADFVQVIETGGTTRCDFSDAFKTMELVFAIDESAETGEAVQLPLRRG